MKVQFVHREDGVIVERGNIVDVLSTDSGWYRIDDGCGSTMLIPPRVVEIVGPLPFPREIHITPEEADAENN